MDRLTTTIFRRLLTESVTLFELGDITAIDASGFDRIAASRRYARRTDYRFLAMKTTLLTDCESGAILDVHCTTSRPHDTQIEWQVLTRNLDRIDIITADKGYDWADLRSMLRANDVRPLIKHREFDSLDKAHNARLDDEGYHHRSAAECSFRVLKQRFGDRLHARAWYRQFREIVFKVAVKNVDEGIGASHADFGPFNTTLLIKVRDNLLIGANLCHCGNYGKGPLALIRFSTETSTCLTDSFATWSVRNQGMFRMAESRTEQPEDRRVLLLELIRRGTEAEPIYRTFYERRYGEVPDE